MVSLHEGVASATTFFERMGFVVSDDDVDIDAIDAIVAIVAAGAAEAGVHSVLISIGRRFCFLLVVEDSTRVSSKTPPSKEAAVVTACKFGEKCSNDFIYR